MGSTILMQMFVLCSLSVVLCFSITIQETHFEVMRHQKSALNPMDTHMSISILECAANCKITSQCSALNFRAGSCELLVGSTGDDFQLTDAEGWKFVCKLFI